MVLFLSLALLFGAAFVAPWVWRILPHKAGWLLALAPLGAFALLAGQLPVTAGGAMFIEEFAWFPALDVSLSLRLDGLSILMGLLITGIGTLIVIYAGGYLHGHPQLGRFYLYLLSFMAAMLGLVLSENLIVLFIFWELTSVTSYLLIGFNHDDKISRWNALQALLVTGLGAVAMLAGFVLIGIVAGSYDLSVVLGSGDLLRGSEWYPAIVTLVLLGAFTKSAQVPFHFWLPNAMAAPTPVSAFLHSATMVKAGIFLMARMNPALGDTALWSITLTSFGAVTLLVGALLGIFQTDLKKIFAYTTLGVLGMLTMLLGLGTELAIQSMIAFLLGHALYKAALFMSAGSVDHETGTRDARLLGGLRKAMPMTALGAVLAALSMGGFPPFFGFIGKEYVYKAGLGMEGIAQIGLVAAFVGNILMFALAFKGGVGPFFGKSRGELPKHPHEAPVSMWGGPLLLALIGLALGMMPMVLAIDLVAPAVMAVEGQPIEMKLELWHGINVPLIMSIMTVAAGLAVFASRHQIWKRSEGILAALKPWGAEACYDRLFHGFVRFSKWQTHLLQSGYLHNYMFIIATSLVALLMWSLIGTGEMPAWVGMKDPDPMMIALVLMMIAAVIIAISTQSRLAALVSLGVVGFGVALIFVYFGAPDLAITQIFVETLTVTLFMFVVYRLPALHRRTERSVRIRDIALSVLFGVLMMLLVMEATSGALYPAISETLAAWSYPEAKGKNVVNVILVDFRALDTFGEITVLVIAAMGITALVSTQFDKKKEGKK